MKKLVFWSNGIQRNETTPGYTMMQKIQRLKENKEPMVQAFGMDYADAEDWKVKPATDIRSDVHEIRMNYQEKANHNGAQWNDMVALKTETKNSEEAKAAATEQ